MRPPDRRAEALAHGLVADGQPVRSHPARDDAVALVPVFQHPLEYRGDLRGLRVDIIPEDVYRSGENRADLDPRHDLKAKARPFRGGGGIARGRVVVGDGDGSQSELLREADDLFRALRAVRFGCVYVQVDLSHLWYWFSFNKYSLFLNSRAHLVVR